MHNQTKASEWEVQDEIWKVVKVWVDKANDVNADQMTVVVAPPAPVDIGTMDEPPFLVGCQITMSMHKLLNLVLRFRESVETRIVKEDPEAIVTHFTKSTTGPTIVDHRKAHHQGGRIIRLHN